MNDQYNIKVDYELLGRYLAGEAGPQEAMLVDDWIQRAPENRLLFEQVSDAWERSLGGLAESSLTGAAESSHAGPAGRGSLRSFSIYRMIGIAACLLLVIVGVWMLFKGNGNKRPADNVAADAPASGNSYVSRLAGNAILHDTLSDLTTVVQYIGSSLKYANSFNKKDREIFLHGEAWFNVSPNPAIPFVVYVGDVKVTVLGTSFNIRESDSCIQASVRTGAIMMSDAKDSLIIKAGQQGLYNVPEKKFKGLSGFDQNQLGYATGVLIFDNIPLKVIAARIEKAYGITVVFKDERLKDLTMSSSFDNNSITYIFDVISLTLHVKYRIEDKTVYISGS